MYQDDLTKEAFIRNLIKNMGSLRAFSRRTGRGAAAGAASAAGTSKRVPKDFIREQRIPKGFIKGLGKGVDPERAWRGYRHQAMSGNDESLLLWPLRSAAEKIIGGRKGIRKVRGGAWKHVGSKILRADMALGRGLQKIPLIGKKMFTVKEDVPWGKGLKKEVERSSALAPLAKTRDIAEPILVGVGLEKGIKTLADKKKQGQDMKDQQLREKVASVMLSLHERNKEHEKRAHALKILYKQAELGHVPLPHTHSELETKLASLVNEDLVVLEKALELAGGNLKLGELGLSDSGSMMSSAEKFQATILGSEL